MKKTILSLCAVVIFASAWLPEAATARSTGNHKSSGSYIHKSCKTKSCFKKHPAGSYGFYSGKKKK